MAIGHHSVAEAIGTMAVLIVEEVAGLSEEEDVEADSGVALDGEHRALSK